MVDARTKRMNHHAGKLAFCHRAEIHIAKADIAPLVSAYGDAYSKEPEGALKLKEMQDKVAQLLAERCGDIDDPGATEDPLPISAQIEIIEEVVSKQSKKRKGTYISGLGAAMKRPPLPRGRGNNAEIKQELMAVKEQNEMQEARIKHLEEMILKLAPPAAPAIAPAADTGNPSDGASLI